MSKEVAKKQSTEVAQNYDLDSWGHNEMSSKDLVIPKIWAMQGLSQLVVDGVFKFGDIVNSITQEKLGDIKTPIEIIPFYMEKLWYVLSQKDPNKNDFSLSEIIPVTAANEKLPYEEVVNGVSVKRQLVRNFYVMIAGNPVPMVLSLKGKSGRTGQVLASQMYMLNKAKKLPPPGMTMTLTAKKEQNEKGTFVVFEVTPSRQSTMQEIEEAFNWYQSVVQGKVKVDNADEDTGTVSTNAVKKDFNSDDIPF